MTHAIIAPGMLLAVLGLALGFQTPRRVAIAAGVALLFLVLALFAASGRGELGVVLTGCWLSLIATAMIVFWPRGWLGSPTAIYLASANAGAWSGLVTASENAAGSLPAIVAPLLLAVPAWYCVRRGWRIAPRVLASWLLAVAVLAAALPFLVEHPGYVPDHRM